MIVGIGGAASLALALVACATTGTPPVTNPNTAGFACGEPLQPYVKASLYMGGGNRNAADRRLTEEEWARFIDDVLLEHFPAGGTILDTEGWWQRPADSTGSNRGRMLVLLHPAADRDAFAAAVREVIAEIKQRYGHRSVLWEEARVCAAF